VPAVGEATCGAGTVEAGAAIAAGTALTISSLSGSNEEIAGNLTISKGLTARFAKENEAREADEEGDCAGTEIKGYTRHGREQVLGRDGVGVSDEAIEDAASNPNEVIPEENGKTKYVGKDATVILNGDGEVITAWANSRSGWR
jgi:hypothetical protein